jgi:hypothetical protein
MRPFAGRMRKRFLSGGGADLFGCESSQTMLMRVLSRAAILTFVIFAVVWPAHGLTSEEVVAKIEAAGYSNIREMTAGKIMTYKAVRAGKEVSLVVDSFGKIKELP